MKRTILMAVMVMAVAAAGAVPAQPAYAADAFELCAGDVTCLDELPVTNDAATQAQLDAGVPPTLVPVVAASEVGAAPLVPGAIVGLAADRALPTLTPAAFPPGYAGRAEVTSAQFPNAQAGHLAIYFNGASVPTGFCSGVTISPHFVGTAGHCVYHKDRGWATRVDYIPGQYGSTTGETGGYHPYGTCYADVLFTVRGWKDDANPSYDYGGVRLGRCSRGDRELGTRTGWAGYHTSSNESLLDIPVNLHGYPSGAPLYKTPGTMWRGMYGAIHQVSTHQFGYRIEAAAGDSGGAVWLSREDCGPGFCVYGVHRGADPDTGASLARRITNGMFNNWKDWKTR